MRIADGDVGLVSRALITGSNCVDVPRFVGAHRASASQAVVRLKPLAMAVLTRHSLSMTSRCLLPLFLALLPVAASAQAIDTELEPLALMRQYDALDTLTRARLARDPQDEAALWYLAEQASDDPNTRAVLLPLVRNCARERPLSSRCEHAMGLLVGADVQADGGFAALTRIGEVREHFERAVALAPANYAMRRDLQALYLEVPALLGGSNRKARSQVQAFAALDPERGHLMEAEMAIAEKAFTVAERELVQVHPAANSSLERDVESVQIDFGSALIDAKQATRAQVWFYGITARDGRSPEAFVGLARALVATGQPVAAARALEHAMKLNSRLSIQHLLASTYEAAGQQEKAMDAYRRVLQHPAEHAYANLARERLAVLQR